MKTLILVRHAKAVKADEFDGRDFDRPLAKQGKRDARRMGERLADEAAQPGLFLSSPAARALATARIVGDEMGLRESAIVKEPKAYEADARGLMAILAGIDDDHDCAWLCGHNPALQDLAGVLTGKAFDNLSPCDVLILRLSIGSWSALAPGRATLLKYLAAAE